MNVTRRVLELLFDLIHVTLKCLYGLLLVQYAHQILLEFLLHALNLVKHLIDGAYL